MKDTMAPLSYIIAVLMLAAYGLSGAARAQDAGDWQSPATPSHAQDGTTYGAPGLQFSFPGWVTFDPPPRPDARFRELISVRPRDNTRPERQCRLSGGEVAGDGRTQAELNAVLQEAASNLAPDPEVRTLKQEVITIDGVAVLDEETLAPYGRWRARTRTRSFLIAAEGRSTRYLLFCTVVGEETRRHATDMDAVMDSLRFSAEPPP